MTFFQRCWQTRWIRGPVWILVSLITFYALVYACVNWSGARQWRAVQAEIRAEGETADFRAVANDPIPDAENFCATPLLKDLTLVVDGDQKKGTPGQNRARLESLKLPTRAGKQPNTANASLGQRANLPGWVEWLRKDGSFPMPSPAGEPARDVLAALSKHDAVIHELAVGLDRPEAQWTPSWKTRELPPMLFSILLPHMSGQLGASRTLALRGEAAARAGEVAKAHESARMMARLSEASLNDPFLIGTLVAANEANLLANTTWALCDAQAGTAEDFAKLERDLTKLDFRRGVVQAFRSEMAGALDTMRYLKVHREEALPLIATIGGDGKAPGSGGVSGKILIHAIPAGFFDASSSVLAGRELRYMIKPLRDCGWPEAIRAAAEFERDLSEMKPSLWRRPSYIVTGLVAPATSKVTAKAAYTQALLNEAAAACALERYRIAHGGYPDALDAVKLADGQPLPLDVISGKPMGYRKTPNGKYALWSVGFDGKDDGGMRVLNPKNPESTKFDAPGYIGDWVWDYPAP